MHKKLSFLISVVAIAAGLAVFSPEAQAQTFSGSCSLSGFHLIITSSQPKSNRVVLDIGVATTADFEEYQVNVYPCDKTCVEAIQAGGKPDQPSSPLYSHTIERQYLKTETVVTTPELPLNENTNNMIVTLSTPRGDSQRNLCSYGATFPITADLRNEVTASELDTLNPLLQSDKMERFSTPGGFLSELLKFAFPLAGIIMFLMITWGGFEIVQGATDKKKLDSGKNRIKAAIVGFMLLFSSFWIMQVVGYIFGAKIL